MRPPSCVHHETPPPSSPMSSNAQQQVRPIHPSWRCVCALQIARTARVCVSGGLLWPPTSRPPWSFGSLVRSLVGPLVGSSSVGSMVGGECFLRQMTCALLSPSCRLRIVHVYPAASLSARLVWCACTLPPSLRPPTGLLPCCVERTDRAWRGCCSFGRDQWGPLHCQ